MKFLLTTLSVVLLLLLPGCLELDAQDITIRYDQDRDRIDMLFVHRGLFAEGEGTGGRDPMAKAIKDLADVRASGEVVFWCNWPFALNLTKDHRPPFDALLAHMEVENGSLFTDPEGRLCGYQFVRIHKASAFLDKLNMLLELAIQQPLREGMDGRDGRHEFDDTTRENIGQFLQSGRKMLVIESGRLAFHLPLSIRDHRWFRHQLELIFRDVVPEEMSRRFADEQGHEGDRTKADPELPWTKARLSARMGSSTVFRFLLDNDWSFVRAPGLTTIALGSGESPDLQISKASDGRYDDALLHRLRAAGESIEEAVTVEELTRRFATFQGRAAVLPKDLATRRTRQGQESNR